MLCVLIKNTSNKQTMAKVVHFEIPAENPKETVDFFTAVFGWKFSKWGDNEYYLTESGPADEPGIEGAIMKRNHPDQPVVNTIEVRDIESAMAAVEDNGGEIVVPLQEVPGVGKHCYFKDPSGYIHGALESDMNTRTSSGDQRIP
jgi:predicted enzyme related to lactoylglutathione lyase